ncbi:MAG: GC-type dockerin domain-anchored protein, partial [bacterium]
ALGQSVQGRLFNSTVGRDTDWFEFMVPALTEVTVSLAAQYPSRLAILEPPVEPDACFRPSVLDISTVSFAQVCGTTTGSVVLEAGTHRLVISNTYFDGIGCGAGYEQYWLSLSGQAVVVACGPSDIAGPGQGAGADGELTADDIIVYLNAFFAGDPIADVAGPGQDPNADMEFTADDIIVFLNRFFAGCEVRRGLGARC